MKYTGLWEHIRLCIEFSWPLRHFICGCKNLCSAVCVFVWCNCNLQGTWVIYGNILAPQHIRLLGALAMSEGKRWVCPLGSQESPAKPTVTPSTALSTSKWKYLLLNTLTDQVSFRSESGSCSFSIASKPPPENKQANKQTKKPHKNQPKNPKNLSYVVTQFPSRDNAKEQILVRNKQKVENFEGTNVEKCWFVPFAKELNKENRTFYLSALMLLAGRNAEANAKKFVSSRVGSERRFISPYYLYDFL